MLKTIQIGNIINYNDGRKGHEDVQAEVLTVNRTGMVVQFADRADTTYINFTDDAWMKYITVSAIP